MSVFAGAAHADITPSGPVWMDGMIREHRSEGIHDRLEAKALVLANDGSRELAFALISMDICALGQEDADEARAAIEARTGIPRERILLCASHTHSGPAAMGFFNPRELEYIKALKASMAETVEAAASLMVPSRIAYGRSEERTISYYRRLMADDGHVVMNWEPFPPERIVGPLGVPDPEVGVLRIVEAGGEGKTIATVFDHADHPNTLSGDSFLISAEYPGLASRLIRESWGGEALFLNGAQGSIDIDNFKDRGLPGLERNGRALAAAVNEAIARAVSLGDAPLALFSSSYTIPARHITPKERSWAEGILASTKGEVHPMADGVGDDYTANLYMRLQKIEDIPLRVEQLCFAIGDCAFVSFPGELYTEIGLAIKAKSAFPHTYVIGLANGSIGYVPTRKAIAEGGYSEVTREVDDSAEEIVLERSLDLLGKARLARLA